MENEELMLEYSLLSLFSEAHRLGRPMSVCVLVNPESLGGCACASDPLSVPQRRRECGCQC